MFGLFNSHYPKQRMFIDGEHIENAVRFDSIPPIGCEVIIRRDQAFFGSKFAFDIDENADLEHQLFRFVVTRVVSRIRIVRTDKEDEEKLAELRSWDIYLEEKEKE